FDTASPVELAAQVEMIQRKSKRLIWVNPLLGRYEEGFIDDKMAPVLPYIDGYTSAHTLESLKQLEKELIMN
ncbi:MAG: carbon monoxide dehydrogenase, partial [Gammaproteobacteria bacterium]